MDETVKKILEKAISVAENTGNFVVEQTPEVIQQLLLWKFAESILAFLLLLAFLIIYVYFINKFRGVIHHSLKGGNEPVWGLIVTPVIMLLVVIPKEITWLKILIAPKLYLLEYGASIIR